MKPFGTGRNAMRWTPCRKIGMGVLGALVSVLLGGAPAGAQIPGLTGTSFSLVATSGYIQNGDGNNLFFWGFADGNPPSGTLQVQYPGPTLIVNEGDTVTVTLTNWLKEPVSLLFPGMDDVTATPFGERDPGDLHLGGPSRRSGHGDLYLHREPAGNVLLPERDEHGQAAGDGALRRDHRAARGV